MLFGVSFVQLIGNPISHSHHSADRYPSHSLFGVLHANFILVGRSQMLRSVKMLQGSVIDVRGVAHAVMCSLFKTSVLTLTGRCLGICLNLRRSSSPGSGAVNVGNLKTFPDNQAPLLARWVWLVCTINS